MLLNFPGRNQQLSNVYQTDRRFFNDLVSLSSESETIGGDGSDIVNQQLDPTGYDGGDNLIDSSIPSTFDIPEHFQVCE